MDIVIYEKRSPEFWSLMGPFFASREVRRDISSMYDDERYVWILAVEDGKVLGFVAVRPSKSSALLSSLYVREDSRGKGIARALVSAHLAYCREHKLWKVCVTAAPSSRAIMEKHGFRETGVRGNSTTMEVHLDVYGR